MYVLVSNVILVRETEIQVSKNRNVNRALLPLSWLGGEESCCHSVQAGSAEQLTVHAVL